jgi:lysine 6-dehydrogenase
VIGTGVGTAIAHWLVQQDDTEQVTVADASGEHAIGACSKIESPLCIPAWLNTTEASGRKLREIFKSFDVIVSAIPAKCSPKLVRCAIEEKKGFCDLGGVLDITRQLEGYSQRAREAGASIVQDCGLMPGLGNVMAQDLINSLDPKSAISVTVRAGGLPLQPKPPTNYGLIFSLEGLGPLCYNPATILHDGHIMRLMPLENVQRVMIPELLELYPQFEYLESFPTAGASLAPWNFRCQGVSHFEEQTLRWPGFVDYVRQIPKEKFVQRLGEVLDPTGPKTPDLAYMEVTATELCGNQRTVSYQLLDHFDQSTGLSAMARTTGIPTAIMAQMVARGTIRPGVWTPEQALEVISLDDTTRAYIEQVRRHIPITRSVETN